MGIASLHPSYAADLPYVQARFSTVARDKLARRANQQNLSIPSRKNIPLSFPPKSRA
jgi:hypothetical protein